MILYCIIKRNTMTPSLLLAFQIAHYTERLKEETRIEARSFLREQLWRLKKVSNDNNY
jgi:hypothetical protein